MSHTLDAVDVAIVVLYILGTTLLGAWFSRQQRDLKTYFVGDRNVSWWLVLISIVATETSTVTFLSVPGLAFGGDMTFLQLAFGYVLGRLLIAWLLLPQYLKGELLSAYQLLRQRFNPAVQRTASGLFLITRTVADGLRLMLTALLLHLFTGWSMELSVLIMGMTTILYTYLGGMQAVIWTDLIQFIIYVLGAIVAAVYLVAELPGGLEGFLSQGSEAGKFAVVDFSFVLTSEYTFWTGLIGGAFFTMASHGADQLMVQRYLCSRSLGAARSALSLSGVVVLLQFTLFLLIGVGLYLLHQQHPILQNPVAPADYDKVFGKFIVDYLPIGIIGLVVAAVLAAAMSTLSSSLNSSANAFVVDFYRPMKGNNHPRRDLWMARVMTSVWGVAQMAVALIALQLPRNQGVIAQVLTVAGFTTGMILGLFLLGSLARPVRSEAALGGLVVGFLVVTAVWLPSLLDKKLLAWPWYAPLGAATTVTVALILNRLLPEHGPPANRGAESGLDQPR